MNATQEVRCSKAYGLTGSTGIITCQRLLADVRRLSRIKVTLCLACSSTVGFGILVNIPGEGQGLSYEGTD